MLDLLFGRGTCEVEIPGEARVSVIRKPEMPVLEDPEQAVAAALTNLSGAAENATSACIAICDITRPVPNHLFLRPMIEEMVRLGIAIERITLLVATGLHRPNVGAELEELIGDRWVLENVTIANHDALADEDHVDLGKTSTRGTPVKLNRRFVEADLRIATGLVEPHFMAGYSGGRKVIAPGLAHAETIKTFHSHAFMADPHATNCNLRHNPLHEEQLQIVEKIGGAYALNTVIDEERKLSMVNFGEVTASHSEAVAYIERFCRVPVPSEFDIVLTSAAGYPLDKTYYQTVKGMVGAAGILAPGGQLIIVSECSEGLGSPDYADAQKRLAELGVSGFLDSIRNKPLADIDEWQTHMQTKAMRKGSIHLFSTLSDDDYSMTCVHRVTDLQKTINECVGNSASKSLAVIPEGPYVIPFIAGQRNPTVAPCP